MALPNRKPLINGAEFVRLQPVFYLKPLGIFHLVISIEEFPIAFIQYYTPMGNENYIKKILAMHCYIILES